MAARKPLPGGRRAGYHTKRKARLSGLSGPRVGLLNLTSGGVPERLQVGRIGTAVDHPLQNVGANFRFEPVLDELEKGRPDTFLKFGGDSRQRRRVVLFGRCTVRFLRGYLTGPGSKKYACGPVRSRPVKLHDF